MWDWKESIAGAPVPCPSQWASIVTTWQEKHGLAPALPTAPGTVDCVTVCMFETGILTSVVSGSNIVYKKLCLHVGRE